MKAGGWGGEERGVRGEAKVERWRAREEGKERGREMGGGEGRGGAPCSPGQLTLPPPGAAAPAPGHPRRALRTGQQRSGDGLLGAAGHSGHARKRVGPHALTPDRQLQA